MVNNLYFLWFHNSSMKFAVSFVWLLTEKIKVVKVLNKLFVLTEINISYISLATTGYQNVNFIFDFIHVTQGTYSIIKINTVISSYFNFDWKIPILNCAYNDLLNFGKYWKSHKLFTMRSTYLSPIIEVLYY